MKSLKLKKIKISRVGNPHLVFGGVQQAAHGQAAQVPDQSEHLDTYLQCTFTLDTKYDDSCLPNTNSGRTGRTGEAMAVSINYREESFN